MAVTINSNDTNEFLIAKAAGELIVAKKAQNAMSASQQKVEALRNDKKKLSKKSHQDEILLYVTTLGKLDELSSASSANLTQYEKELVRRGVVTPREQIEAEASKLLNVELAQKETDVATKKAPVTRRHSDQALQPKPRDAATDSLLDNRRRSYHGFTNK